MEKNKAGGKVCPEDLGEHADGGETTLCGVPAGPLVVTSIDVMMDGFAGGAEFAAGGSVTLQATEKLLMEAHEVPERPINKSALRQLPGFLEYPAHWLLSRCLERF